MINAIIFDLDGTLVQSGNIKAQPYAIAVQRMRALAGMRTEIYDNMVEDPQVLSDNQWPLTIGLLRVAREKFCRTAMATMSYRKEALHVLRLLELEDSVDEVLTSEDVQNPKPDPEIYLLAA